MKKVTDQQESEELDELTKLLERAARRRFGLRSREILISAWYGPTSPYRFFGIDAPNLAYGYFERLHAAGFLRRVEASVGCRGTTWYVACLVQQGDNKDV